MSPSSSLAREDADLLSRELLDLFAQLLGVVASLDTKWTKALLHRTQFSNTRFLAELLTSFQLLGTSLGASFLLRTCELTDKLCRNWNAAPDALQPPPRAIPQTDRDDRSWSSLCVLLRLQERRELTHWLADGFDATLDNHAIEGIPQHVDLATICSLEYLRFSCGISLCYAIVNVRTPPLVPEVRSLTPRYSQRMDRLMVRRRRSGRESLADSFRSRSSSPSLSSENRTSFTGSRRRRTGVRVLRLRWRRDGAGTILGEAAWIRNVSCSCIVTSHGLSISVSAMHV